jgi:hypothetical protein
MEVDRSAAALSGVFELAPLRDSRHVNDKVKLTEAEIQALSHAVTGDEQTAIDSVWSK